MHLMIMMQSKMTTYVYLYICMCLCVCTYVCMYTCMYVYICVCIFIILLLHKIIQPLNVSFEYFGNAVECYKSRVHSFFHLPDSVVLYARLHTIMV